MHNTQSWELAQPSMKGAQLNLHIKSVKKHKQIEFVTTKNKFNKWTPNIPIEIQSAEIPQKSLNSVSLKPQFMEKMDLAVHFNFFCFLFFFLRVKVVNVQCHVFLEIIQHRLLECLDGWEEKLNYQQCQQTAALANSCILEFWGFKR